MSRLLDQHINVLCREHTRRSTTPEGDVYGVETALLVQLTQAVASDRGRGSVAGRSVTGSPVDLGALTLLQDITRTVDEAWPYRGDPGMVRVPVWHRLTAWAANTLDPVDVAELTEQAGQWVDQIRRHLEPPIKVTLNGACPDCGHTHVVTIDDDGQAIHNPTLVAHQDHAACQVCEAEWWGPAMHDLAHHLRHA